MPTVAVAIPAHNEAEGIGGFLVEIDEALSALADVTFVVVDDRSTDDTRAELEEVRPKLVGTLTVIESERNRGHGPTLLAAYRHALDAGAEYVLAVDGDGQFLGADLRRMYVLLADGGEGVCGVRRFRYDPWFRMLMTRLLRAWVMRMYGVPTRDANCPLRGYRAELLDQLLRSVPADSLVPNVHLAVLAARHGATLVEVDVHHRVRRGSSPVGTMFASETSARTIRRLMEFSWRARKESLRFRRDINSGRPPERSAREP